MCLLFSTISSHSIILHVLESFFSFFHLFHHFCFSLLLGHQLQTNA